MKFRRTARPEEGINLTPLIDVVFLLLIFFMVSTTFTKETHLELDLPEASAAPMPEDSARIEIVVNAEGGYAVNGRGLINKQLDTLKAAIEQSANGNNQLPLTITADARSPHQAVVTAMDAAGQLGFAKLSITTRNPSDE